MSSIKIGNVSGDISRSVIVGRDIINSIINTGDHNQFFIGPYERLQDAYLEPWSVFERVGLDHFVGREWLLAEIDAFLCDHDRGYFILEAEAGLGKTTFLAWLTRERGYIHHFSELAPGLDGVGRGLKNLAAQLVLAYHLNAYEAEGVLPGAATRSDFLHRLLKQAAGQRQEGEKIVLVVDALDEAGTPPNQNVLGLPQVLPEGVFIIVSQRPVPVSLHVDTATTPRHQPKIRLTADSAENQADMRRFLEGATTWTGIAQALQQSGYSAAQFVAALLSKCQGVWIYLHYVIHEIEQGERSPLILEALPNGLTQFYVRYWQRWRDEDETAWDSLYLPLLATLAAAQEVVLASRLLEWAGVQMPETRLRRLLNERWRPFLALTGEGQQSRYRFYHATLHEFFDGQADRSKLTNAEIALLDELATATRTAHHRLVERYLNTWGGLEQSLPGLQEAARDLDEGYGLRHLANHLIAAGRAEELHRLLALETKERQNVWYEAKETIGDTAGYLADVNRAWQAAEEEFSQINSNKSSAISLQCRYALVIASLNSIAQNIPLTLLKALIEKGVWSYTQGLAYARQVPDLEKRVMVLIELLPFIPNLLKNQVLWEAVVTAEMIKGEGGRVRMVAELMPFLPEALKIKLLGETLQITQEVKNKRHRMKVAAELIPHLPEALRNKLVKDTLVVPGPFESSNYYEAQDYALVLVKVSSYLSEPLQSEIQREALAILKDIPMEKFRLETLGKTVQYLQPQFIREILEIAQATKNVDQLMELAQQLAKSGYPSSLSERKDLPEYFSVLGAFANTKPTFML